MTSSRWNMLANLEQLVPRQAEAGNSRPSADDGDMVEIRWHGRGGQGAVTASELLAESALLEGRYFQAFPEFGAERTGAPIRAFTRLSSHPIDLHCPVEEPSVVVVLDATLLGAVDVSEGLKSGGVALVNTPLPAGKVAGAFPSDGIRVCTVDATGIALAVLGRNIPNVAMLGALLKLAPVVDKDVCQRAIEKKLSARFPPGVVVANVSAFQRGYAEVREA